MSVVTLYMLVTDSGSILLSPSSLLIHYNDAKLRQLLYMRSHV